MLLWLGMLHHVLVRVSCALHAHHFLCQWSTESLGNSDLILVIILL